MKREFILEAKLHERSDSNGMTFMEKNTEFESAVRDALVTSLPKDLQEIYDMAVKVQIKAIRYGSLTVFFSVAVAGLSALSRYKNLYDSIELIRHQADAILESLKRRFGEFNVSVSILYPRLVSPYERHHPLHHEMFLEEFALPDLRAKRDSFFYFLLSWSVVSLIVIGLLVYAAVRKTYFL